ncbi:TPA: hypothetical protein I8235_000043 [Kluyvera intermedia]|nr:hypothetical protein [Kluyvera intermedia]
MPRANVPLQAFNRGIVSPLALARTDIERIALSAEIQTNWMPRTLGSMMLRPGTKFVGRTKNDSVSRFLKFVFSTTDTALIELTDGTMRVWVNDALVTRTAVSSVVTNGSFLTDLSGWTDADEADSSSVWSSDGMKLTGNGATSAIRYQQVTVAPGDMGKQHSLLVNINRGPVKIKVGTSHGDDSYISTTLLEGSNSLTLTPSGNFFIQFSSAETYPVLVKSVSIQSSGVMEVSTPWRTSDLPNIQYTQSGDVLFVGCEGFQQRRIERRDNNSWSVVSYTANDGPYNVINVTGTSIKPSATSGQITLTASSPIFHGDHVGALYRLESTGQTVNFIANGEGQWSGYIKVTGIDDSRKFTIQISNTDPLTPWAPGVITLQRSVSEPGAWTDVKTFTATTTQTYDDDLNNNTIYYRIGVAAGDWSGSAGSVTLSLEYSGGSHTGTARIISVQSATQATAIVLTALGNTDATTNWYEGAWSPYRGYPSAVAIYEGRLWWAGSDRIYGSYSDAYDSFDDGLNTEDLVAGDASGINRSIGSGPVATINWMLPLLRLMVGTDGCEASIQSSSYGEVVTPNNFHIKYPSTRGSNIAGAVVIDSRGVFIHRSGTRLYELAYTSDYYDYSSTDLTSLSPEILQPGVSRVDIQRLPDDRIHCVRTDGTVAVFITDPVEDMRCWVNVETDGLVEDVVTLPGGSGVIEDRVYYVVNRNGKRCLERWAKESECIGGQLCKLADSHVSYSGSAISSISGLSHLEGKSVVAWADGKDIGTFTVSGGSISLGGSYSSVVAGLAYKAKYKSTKLAYAAGMGTALTQRKRVDKVGLIMQNTHAQGLTYGPDFDRLDDLPREEGGAYVPDGHIWDSYDRDAIEFGGEWDTDSRICLEANAPRPVTVLAAIIGVYTHDK